MTPIVLYEPPKRQRTDYRIGLSAWTDKSMLAESDFYPRKTMTAEERLWWYSRFFDTVEVNSSFYAVPSVETTAQWVARTPPGFLFDVKAYGLLTGHDVEVARLPEPLKKMLPRGTDKRRHLRSAALGSEARSWALAELRKALRPLADANKLGYVLFQLAPWIRSDAETWSYLSALPRALPGIVIAIEFRNRSWFGTRTNATLEFLAEHGLTYVSIDGPRSRAGVPSLPALTSPSAVFRLHGRNFKGLLAQLRGKSPTVAEKYDYLYNARELEEIARAAGAFNGKAKRVHLAMNNNRRDYPVINGLQLKTMLLEDWQPPDRARLIDEFEERRTHARRRRRAA